MDICLYTYCLPIHYFKRVLVSPSEKLTIKKFKIKVILTASKFYELCISASFSDLNQNS